MLLPDFFTSDAVQVTVADRESDDRCLTVRPHLFTPAGRMVVCITVGDDELEPLAVALDWEDVVRVHDAMSAWLTGPDRWVKAVDLYGSIDRNDHTDCADTLDQPETGR